MWTYETTLQWTGGKAGQLTSASGPAIPVAVPPDFGGPEGCWSPEALMASAVASCILATTLFYFERHGVTLQAYRCESRLTLHEAENALHISALTLKTAARVRGGREDAEKARQLLLKAEAACPLSAGLQVPIKIEFTVSADETNAETTNPEKGSRP
jgi:organic hydroperoxide reductase OsmC/OhrA